jgi:hypothetical protein
MQSIAFYEACLLQSGVNAEEIRHGKVCAQAKVHRVSVEGIAYGLVA